MKPKDVVMITAAIIVIIAIIYVFWSLISLIMKFSSY
jgi:preprotein translocase subunit Sec61beta